VIIPVYNEYNHIDLVIQAIKTVKLPEQIKEMELILVDDGSKDGTNEKLEKYKNDKTIIVHSSRINFGKGTATRVGLTYVTGDIVLIQDADTEYDPADYPALLQPIIEGLAEVVYGSRFIYKSWPEGMAWQNWLANQLLRIAVNMLYRTRLTDEATAYKVFKTTVVKSLNLKAKRFEFCPEVTAKILKKGYKIKEVPVKYKGRSVSEGKKIKWHDGFSALWTLLKYRLLN
jgi:glycosyltransferase involved in cell wall biosynthesis